MSTSEPKIYHLYRMKENHADVGETIEFTDFEEFKVQMLMDCNDSVAMCFTIGSVYTRNCTKAIEMAEELSTKKNEIIVYNYPTIPINVEVLFTSTEQKAHFIYNLEEECTKEELVLKLYEEEKVREMFVEGLKEGLLKLAATSEVDHVETKEILKIDTNRIFSHCMREEYAPMFNVGYEGSRVEGKVVSCIGDEPYPTVVVKFPKVAGAGDNELHINLSELL